MERLRKILPYVLSIALIFYGSWFLIRSTSAFIVLVFIAMPILCFLTSVLYGYKHGFQWLYPLLVVLVFLPIVIFETESFITLLCIYGCITAVGTGLGSLFYQKKEA